jgi:hypothetical protein
MDAPNLPFFEFSYTMRGLVIGFGVGMERAYEDFTFDVVEEWIYVSYCPFWKPRGEKN